MSAPPWDIIVADWFDRALPSATPRRVKTAHVKGKADAVIGMRRSGKTYLVLAEIAARVAAGGAREAELYVSFEDERLADVDVAALGALTEAWLRRYPSLASSGTLHLALDEVQNVAGWEKLVRRLLDRGGIHLTVTGSSARMLSREIATSLRGRSLTTEVLPFGLDERLRHEGWTVPSRWPPPERERAHLQQAALRYLVEGGFPEVVGLDEDARVRVLRDYVDVVLFRDIVERHGATNVHALRRIVRRLASSPATALSVHRLHNDLKSQGIAVGKDTLYEYLDYVEDAYLAFRVPIRTTSERVRASNPVKTYPIDPGLARAFAARPEAGHLLENAVYLELRRRGGDIAWYKTKSGFEIDFVVERDGDLTVVQACADPSAAGARDRELRALAEAMAELETEGRPTESFVVTVNHDEVVKSPAGTIRFVPAWRWLIPSTGA